MASVLVNPSRRPSFSSLGGSFPCEDPPETPSEILSETPSANAPEIERGTPREKQEKTRSTSSRSLYWHRERYYDPTVGKFLTDDPIDFAGGDTNLYRYVGNNPYNLIDPTGRSWARADGGAAGGDDLPPRALTGATANDDNFYAGLINSTYAQSFSTPISNAGLYANPNASSAYIPSREEAFQAFYGETAIPSFSSWNEVTTAHPQAPSPLAWLNGSSPFSDGPQLKSVSAEEHAEYLRQEREANIYRPTHEEIGDALAGAWYGLAGVSSGGGGFVGDPVAAEPTYYGGSPTIETEYQPAYTWQSYRMAATEIQTQSKYNYTAQLGSSVLRAAADARGSINPNTQAAATRGSTLHSDKPGNLPDQLRQQYPETQFHFTKSGEIGQDVQVVGGKHPSAYPASLWPQGANYADFKPDTIGGTKTFNFDQKYKWGQPTHKLTYDPATGKLQ